MKYADIEWRDGQAYSPAFDDIYFSSEGGTEETRHVFLRHNGLPGRWQSSQNFCIAETGFGTGLNFVVTAKSWLETSADQACLHYVAIEKHPVSPDDITRLAEFCPELKTCFDALLDIYPLPIEGFHCRVLFNGRIYLHFVFMDVQKALSSSRMKIDAWYLDGFDPAKNPDIWCDEVFRYIAHNSAPGATLSSFTCAGSVRRGLVSAGFAVVKVAGFGRKREMISAVLDHPLTTRSTAPWYELPVCRAKNKTAIVIGAGIAGLTTAWSLVQRGWRVTVVDKHQQVAQEASGNPAGLVMPRLSGDDDTDVQFYSSAFLYALDQLGSLQRTASDRFWFNDGVYAATEPDRAEKIISCYDYPAQYMHVSAPDVSLDIPAQAGSAVSFPLAGWVIPGKLCEALVHACGDSLDFQSSHVATLEKNTDGWNALDDNGCLLGSASVVVLANGTGVNAFAQTSWMLVSSIRGQLTFVPANARSSGLRQALSFDSYVTPQHNGVHCVGATYSYVNTSHDLMQQDQDTNLDRLDNQFPGVFERPAGLAGRVGFRAVSADRVPVVGAVPDVDAFEHLYRDLHHGRTNVEYEAGVYLEGLYVSAAHGSRGLCSSFLSAEIIASMIENTPLPVSKVIADYLNPARYIIRRLRRSRKKTG